MKKYFIGLIAIIAVVTCAFAFKPSAKFAKQEPQANKQVSLYWFTTGSNPTYLGRQNTHANEVSPSGCPDTGNTHCEDGYDNDDLATSGDPYSGLKSEATINDFIRKQ